MHILRFAGKASPARVSLWVKIKGDLVGEDKGDLAVQQDEPASASVSGIR
jgi:hypothetical protein